LIFRSSLTFLAFRLKAAHLFYISRTKQIPTLALDMRKTGQGTLVGRSRRPALFSLNVFFCLVQLNLAHSISPPSAPFSHSEALFLISSSNLLDKDSSELSEGKTIGPFEQTRVLSFLSKKRNRIVEFEKKKNA